MSGHLCLKWNNHSSAFLKSISNIQIKGRFCDATVVCQGKYFPVHRIILSTCSDYFDEIFERIQCQHPYVVFKDIEPREMELLLNYMYQGEVNVVQEMLPTLIKAAEALRVKGLAVPDDLPSNKESSGKKRSNSSNENHQPKRRLEESRRRRDSSELNTLTVDPENFAVNDNDKNHSERITHLQSDGTEAKIIKQEPLDTCEYSGETLPSDGSLPTLPGESQSINKESSFLNFPVMGDSSSYMKTEDNLSSEEPFEEQSSAWTDFGNSNIMENIPHTEMSGQDDMDEINRESECEDFTTFRMRSNSATTPQINEGQESLCDLEDPRLRKVSVHQCSYCPYKSNVKRNLERHNMFKHTGERPFPCEICPLRFAMKMDLQRHVLTHTGEKPHKCPHCLKAFIREDQMRNHSQKSRCRRQLKLKPRVMMENFE